MFRHISALAAGHLHGAYTFLTYISFSVMT